MNAARKKAAEAMEKVDMIIEVLDARIQPGLQVAAGFLCFGAEDRVSTTGVRDYRMGASILVAKFHSMCVAGASTIQITCASG